jgi:hypothetical protein
MVKPKKMIEKFDGVDSTLKFHDENIKNLANNNRVSNVFFMTKFGIKFFKKKYMFALINYNIMMFDGFAGYIQVDTTKISRKILISSIKAVALCRLKCKTVFVEERFLGKYVI